VQPLGDAVDEEVGDHELAEVAAGEGLVLRPQPLGDLAHRGAAQQDRSGCVAKGRLGVPRAQPACVHLDGELLELGRAPGQPGLDPRHERLGAIGHRGTPYSIGPSAVRSRARR
jgi:hypothetical protein